MSVDDSNAVDRVICLFQAHGLSENKLVYECASSMNCAVTKNKVHQGTGSYTNSNKWIIENVKIPSRTSHAESQTTGSARRKVARFISASFLTVDAHDQDCSKTSLPTNGLPWSTFGDSWSSLSTLPSN